MSQPSGGTAPPRALGASLAVLACPHCRGDLALAERSLVCERAHRFDIARQGYVNLLGGRGPGGTADTAAMVGARVRFLGRGHYAPLTQALAQTAAAAVGESAPGHILDIGAGPGHHLAAVIDRFEGSHGLALDLSKHALRRAARCHPRVAAAVCDTWKELPVRDAAVALALAVFAPRTVSEIARVLRPGGAFVLATPTPAHLRELVDALGLVTVDPRKRERTAAQIGDALRLEGRSRVSYMMELDRPDVEALVLMGPSARHVFPGAVAQHLRRVGEPVRVRCDVEVAVYRVP